MSTVETLGQERPVEFAAETVLAARAIDYAVEAYIYGYPLVTMELTRRVMTNAEKPDVGHAPMGQLVRMAQYPSADFKSVTTPNADTLYTAGFLDVGKEPWVLSLPEAKGRYYLMPMLSAWTDVFQSPGKRTTGTGPQQYAITGPGWVGSLPTGMTQYKSPTAMVWLLGRIYCTGTLEDYVAVHKMQADVTVVPLSSYGQPYTPPAGKVDPSVDMKTSVRDQVNQMDLAAYFNLLASLLKDNPPAREDAPVVARMAKLGIVAGLPFDAAKLNPAIARANVPKISLEKIMAHRKHSGRFENGWGFTTKTGLYGTDYLQRALVAAMGLGANRPQDAVYPMSETDADGKPYDGANHYVMHFNKGEMPPVHAFWSLTMYDAQLFFVANPLNRHTLSARDKLKANSDGSVDLYLQKDSPGEDKEANWLPAPDGRFIPMLRLYWPREKAPSILDGSWKIPPIKKVS
jgi:hypothetical protein